MPEPNRTPGKAEGTVEDVENSLLQAEGKAATATSEEDLSREPGRTPGKAEGTVEEVQGSEKSRPR